MGTGRDETVWVRRRGSDENGPPRTARNERKTDVGALVNSLLPMLSLAAAGFAWYVTESSTKVAAQEIEDHDKADNAHYQKYEQVRKRVDKHDLDITEIRGSLTRIEDHVQANKEAQDDIRDDQREILRLLQRGD